MEAKNKKTCFKCKQAATLKYRRDLLICRECFDLYVVRKKFRQNMRNQVDVIGKSNQIVAFLDGTLQSACLVKLFAENLKRNSPALKSKTESAPHQKKSANPDSAQGRLNSKTADKPVKVEAPQPLVDEQGKPLSKNQLKKRRKKKVFKRMFIEGHAVFFDFRSLLGDRANFLGRLNLRRPPRAAGRAQNEPLLARLPARTGTVSGAHVTRVQYRN